MKIPVVRLSLLWPHILLTILFSIFLNSLEKRIWKMSSIHLWMCCNSLFNIQSSVYEFLTDLLDLFLFIAKMYDRYIKVSHSLWDKKTVVLFYTKQIWSVPILSLCMYQSEIQYRSIFDPMHLRLSTSVQLLLPSTGRNRFYLSHNLQTRK